MSEQRSADNEIAAGCALNETRAVRRATHAAVVPSMPDDNLLFAWGRGEDGQLGLGDTNDQTEPTYVDALRGVSVAQIACGSGHTVVLTTEGNVYTWGRGDDGRLGHGDNGWKYVPKITQALQGQRVVQVTCGSYHTTAVSQEGTLWTWGGGMYGKLGHGNERGEQSPRRVEALANIPVAQIACGSRHTAVVSRSGDVYTWGDKENGVAGHGETDGHQYLPLLLHHLSGKRVVQISACGFHTAVVTDQQELYTWGEGKFGRLGHNSERNAHTPQLVESMKGKRPKQVACGGFHSAVITEDGHLYTFGGGEHGQLGHGDRTNKLKPTFVQALEGKSVIQITCGWSHSVALTRDGQVYTWGNGDHGKLGLGNCRKVAVPQLVEKLKNYHVIRVASYNEHTAALVEPLDPSSIGAGNGNGMRVSGSYASQLRSLVNDDEFSDVTFILENQHVYAHRAILAARCELFAAMLRSGMRESVEGVIPIPNIRRSVFLLLLEYIYCDTVKVPPDQAIELYICADQYNVERLRDICCNVVRRHLNPENAGPLLQAASEHHCLALKEHIMKYVVDNFDAFSRTDGIRHVSHQLLLEIISQRRV